jgi:hypothetical protein
VCLLWTDVVFELEGDDMTRCPLDEHALVERLKEWELEAHKIASNCPTLGGNISLALNAHHTGQMKAYRRVIDLIENGRVRQQHRELMNK